MSDNFRCELIFPRNALSRDSIGDALQYDLNLSAEEMAGLREDDASGCDMISPDYDQPGLLCVCDVHARNGELEATERALFEAGFAFDANAEGYMEIEPEFRYWRPGMELPASLQRTEGGDAYTLTQALREAITHTASMTDPNAIRAEFEQLAEETDPAILPIEGLRVCDHGKRRLTAPSADLRIAKQRVAILINKVYNVNEVNAAFRRSDL